MLEGAANALEAIGAAAAGPIIDHLRDDDMARQIYLTGVLEQIPTEGAAQAILDWLADGEPFDEAHATTLAGIGSPSAIEPLVALWKAEPDKLLAESLLVLCELNGVARPELPEWRRVVEAEEARVTSLFDGFEPFLKQFVAASEGPVSVSLEPQRRTGPKQPSVQRSKGLSKKERKKRAAQRRGKGKKKRKR